MKKGNGTTKQIVKPMKLLFVVGVISSFFFPIIWLLSIKSEGWGAWGFHVVYGSFTFMAIVLILIYLNCRITYTDTDFTVRNILRISRTYRYDQITGIETGEDTNLRIGKKKITINVMSEGSAGFLAFANQRYKELHNTNYRRGIPEVPPAKDIFNGNIEYGTTIFVMEVILLCAVLAGTVFAYIRTGLNGSSLIKVIFTGLAVIMLIYITGSVVVGRNPGQYSRKVVNLFFKDSVVRSYRISNDRMWELWQLPWEELVVKMYNKDLHTVYGKPVSIVYNKEGDKRYFITKVKKGYRYEFQRLRKLREDEWFLTVVSEDDLPAEWDYLMEQESPEIYQSAGNAMQALEKETEYKTYYRE